jgi:hypothetical protein
MNRLPYLDVTYHNSKNEYPVFEANLTYNEKRILASPEANK